MEGLLGTPIPRARCREILEALEFTVSESRDGLDVTVPAFRRADVTREADLIEEVARLDGVDKLPATLPSRHGAAGRLTVAQRQRRAAADALTAQGLDEIVGWSFVGAELAQRLRFGDREAVELENPMSADQSQLRTTLLGSLLEAARRNRSHGASVLRLFEAGAVYLPAGEGELPREPHHVAALLTGRVRRPTWRDPDPAAGRLLRRQGRAGRSARRAARRLAGRARPGAVPASRARRADPGRRPSRPAGSARSIRWWPRSGI